MTGKTPSELYHERIQRIEDAVNLKTPDSVPIIVEFSYLTARYANISNEIAFYDLDNWVAASKKIVLDLKPDMSGPVPLWSGKGLDIIKSKQLKWPGHGISENSCHQYVEGEYMKADEYDEYLKDNADFIIRKYLPRTCEALEPLKMLPPLGSFASLGMGMSPIAMISQPELAKAFKLLYEMGEVCKPWTMAGISFIQDLKNLGYPQIELVGGMAPFDQLSDLFRGMRGLMLDMFRQPEKLLEVMNEMLPSTLKRIKFMPKGENRIVMLGPHRGADGFMSVKQFETFYWPYLKSLILCMIDEGFIPYMFWEGNYTTRLEYLTELPPGKVLHRFDQTDIFRAREVLGKDHCISGGLMPSLLKAGSVDDVKAVCKKIIDGVGKDGAYVMSTSCGLDEAKIENVKAMFEFTREYGKYR